MTSVAAYTVTDADRLRLLRVMLKTRIHDDLMRSLYRQGKVAGGVYLGKGQEAFSAAPTLFLRHPEGDRPGDILAPLIREGAARMGFGESLANAFRTYLGKRTGNMAGRDGNIHRGDLSINLLPMISHLGAMIAPVAGMLLARRLRGGEAPDDRSVGVAFIGDGGMGTGALHEALNVIAVERLPVVLFVANNQFAYSTPNDRSFACRHLVDRAAGYGVSGHVVDGEVPDACIAVAYDAIAAARRGDGPQMVVGHMLRMSGHGEHDDATYVPAAIRATAKDPIEVAKEQYLANGVLDETELAAMRDELTREVQAVADQVLAEPDADPRYESWRAYAGNWPGLNWSTHDHR